MRRYNVVQNTIISQHYIAQLAYFCYYLREKDDQNTLVLATSYLGGTVYLRCSPPPTETPKTHPAKLKDQAFP